MRKLTLWILILLIGIHSAYGAIVSGNLYDSKLNLINNVLVEITTNPLQSYVSKDGFYTFTLTDGRYQLRAYYNDENGTTFFTTKEVIASGAGMFKVDLVLDKLYNGTPPSIKPEPEFSSLEFVKQNWIYFAGFLIIAVFLLLAFKFLSKAPVEASLPKELDEVLKLVRLGGGRLTQRELRKKLPLLSESKISLMISELEDKKLIEKIKKGRGNILLLKNGKD